MLRTDKTPRTEPNENHPLSLLNQKGYVKIKKKKKDSKS